MRRADEAASTEPAAYDDCDTNATAVTTAASANRLRLTPGAGATAHGEQAKEGEQPPEEAGRPDHRLVACETTLNVGCNPGGAHGEWSRGAAGGHLCTNKAGSNDVHGHTGAAEGFGQSLGETVEAGLGSAIDEVGTADPESGHGGEHDDASMTLLPQAGRHLRHGRCGPDEVDRHHACDPIGIRLVHGLGPEFTHGDDDEVDRLSGRLEAPRDGLLDVVERAGVERHRSHSRHAVTKVLRRPLECQTVAPGEHDGSAAVGDEQCDKLSGDVRRPAEHDDRLGVTERVVHYKIPSRRERSEASTRSGSTLRRTLAKSPSRGYITGRSSGRSRESLAR